MISSHRFAMYPNNHATSSGWSSSHCRAGPRPAGARAGSAPTTCRGNAGPPKESVITAGPCAGPPQIWVVGMSGPGHLPGHLIWRERTSPGHRVHLRFPGGAPVHMRPPHISKLAPDQCRAGREKLISENREKIRKNPKNSNIDVFFLDFLCQN
jgi:hypothetical protein